MNLHHLQYFYFVAKEGGYTRASQVLRIRQPAISRMVGQLEEQLGFKLFERQGRQVQLTSQGKLVFDRAQRIFGEVENLKASLGMISGECHGDLTIGAAEPIAAHLIPMALKRYVSLHKKVHPQVISAPASYVFDRIVANQLEIGMLFHIPTLPQCIEIFARRSFRFHLVAKAGLEDDKRALTSFIGSREIDDTTTRRFPILDLWKKKAKEAKISISTNSLTAHKHLVLVGAGVAVLPAFLCESELKSGKLVDLLPKENLEFDLKIVKKEYRSLSLNAEKFIEAFDSING